MSAGQTDAVGDVSHPTPDIEDSWTTAASDRSMTVLEYVLALVAIGAATLLALPR
jgi:hypothetical protein